MNFLNLIRTLAQLFFSQGSLLNLTETRALRFSKEILQQIRRIIMLLAVTLGGLLLFLLGMHFLVLRLLDQLDRGEFTITPSIIFLVVFLTLCLGVVVYATRVQTWSKGFSEKEDEENVNQSAFTKKFDGSAIESAVSLYILDLVKEREYKRSQRTETQKNESNPSQG